MSDIGLPPDAPAVPSRLNDQQLAFDTKTEAYLNWQDAFRAWLSDFRAWLIGERAVTINARNDALAAAAAAAAAADVAGGAANFAGLWPSLRGRLGFPATVKDDGRFWLLLQDLDDVTAHKPAEGPYWTSRDAGVITRAVVADETATFGVVHAFQVPGKTLQIPADPLHGDFVEIANGSGKTCWLDWSGRKVNNQLPRALMAMPPGARVRVVWYAEQETWA